MEKQEPCYFCIAMSLVLTIGLCVSTVWIGRKVVRLAR